MVDKIPGCSTGTRALSIFVLLVVGSLEVSSQTGHSIVGDQIVVEGRRHWENWSIPANLAHIDSLGRAAPRTFRTVYNVLADTSFRRPLEIFSKDARIATIDSAARRNDQGEILLDTQGDPIFDYAVRPGISRVGSNPQLANNIFDGDPTTFWEPDPEDPISQWWIEVDLARVVPLERLRLQFVDQELGDPFLRFILLLSERQTPGQFEEGNLRFSRFTPFESPNTEQRIFVFESGSVSQDLPSADVLVEGKRFSRGGVATGRHQTNIVANESNAEWTGRKAETIRIVITDSRHGRAEQITEEQWQALAVGERGDIEYFVQDLSGREEPVGEATYLALEPERQGRRIYYRRELPRLAEVSAWAMGDNLSLGLAQDGGSISHTFSNAAPIAAFDGDGATRYQHAARDPEKPDNNILIIDLGGSIWLNQIRYFAAGMRGYLMRGSSGARDAQGELVWQTVSPPEREKNVDNGFFTTINDVVESPIKLRFLELTTFVNANVDNVGASIDNFWPWITEVQIFSEGPAAEVVIESDLVEMDGQFNLGAIEWVADTPPGTEVEIRTRTGNQLFQIVKYFKNSGEEQTQKEYDKLPGFLKGETDTTLALGPDWSPWSRKYGASGAAVTSPSLRRYMQVQARLVSNTRDAAPALERITVQMHAPVVQQLQAELWPAETMAGILDTFEVFVSPGFLEQPFASRNLGFDELLLWAEPRWDMALLDVAVGTDEGFQRQQPGKVYDVVQGTGLANIDGEVVEVMRDQGDSVWVRFPQTLQSQEEGDRLYFRRLESGDQVPTSVDGQLLSITAYSQLPLEEQGAINYYQLVDESGGLEEIGRADYELLEPAEQGPIRYFRIVTALGEESFYNANGDTLTLDQYNRLSSSVQGAVVGQGELVRLRFGSRIFLRGANVKVAVRNSTSEGVWQEAQGGDVTAAGPGNNLAIQALGGRQVVDQVQIAPNPFTPNGDSVNDRMGISFSVFKVHAARPAAIHFYSLDGRLVRTIEESVLGGTQQFEWDGRDDHGGLVPPGLYIVQIDVGIDATDAEGQQESRLVGVVY
ncbi:MAG: hypothetical protein GKR89_18820 [Candidatus Latescibacteria bacterium]|nr:hypothetical protein [Candidatus Latescibacterota bacterium]